MKAQELRIGNLIGFIKPENTAIITEIFKGDDNEYLIETISNSERPIEDYEPIPLTEEWLVKFRFEKKEKYIKHGNGADWKPEYPRNEFDSMIKEIGEDCYFGIVLIINKWMSKQKIETDYFSDVIYGSFYETQVDSSDFLGIECNFVHQLQNLYFALTGEELTIK